MPRDRARGRWRRIALAAAASVVVAVVAGALAAWLAVRASLPPQSGAHAIDGLSAPLVVRLDARARPYVRAATFDDALRAQGWLHATNRTWQMELLRRAGSGHLAELMGAGLLETDRELWRAGVPQLAARLERNADPVTLAAVDAYVAGVNAGLAALRVRPPELLLLAHAPRAWTRRDVFAVGAMVAFNSANNLRDELLRAALRQRLDPARYAAFVPDEAALPGATTTLAAGVGTALEAGDATTGTAAAASANVSCRPPAVAVDELGALATLRRLDAALDPLAVAGLPSAAFGSNSWVVAPSRTRGGRPLFALDSHDSLQLPNLFYEVHLWFGDASLRGWSVPGLPGVINGFNERLAWGFTNMGDTQDLYVHERDAADPRRFRDAEGWYAARIETVRIPVRGRTTPETLEIVHTRRGPLIADAPALSLAWTGHGDDAHGLDGLLAMNLAGDWPSFRAALDRLYAPSANVTYADVDGRIAFRTVGRLPVRGRGDGLAPLRAAEPETAWRGFVAPDALPALVDPPAGFAAAANSRVALPGSAPLVSADNAPDYRLRRIQAVLGAGDAHDVASMQRLQIDWRNEQAALLLPALLPALDAFETSALESRVRERLQAWAADPVAAPNLAAPLAFERWYLALAARVFASSLGDELYGQLLRRNYVLNHALDRLIVAERDSPWWDGRRDALVAQAFRDAVAALAREHGDDPDRWRWGDVHRVRLAHELGRAIAPLARWLDRTGRPWGGGTSTVGRANYRYDRGEAITHAATVRVVVELDATPRAYAITPAGQSGHPSSPHYSDQLDDWLAGRLDALATRPEDVEGRRFELRPRATRP